MFDNLSPEQQLRFDLALIHRYMADHHWHEGVVNHLTAMLPGSVEHFLALPYGLHWSEVKSSDFLVAGFDGHVVSGEGEVILSFKNIFLDPCFYTCDLLDLHNH